MIDCSHANSQRRHEQQQDVARDVAAQIAGGDGRIFGVMIESHLNPGRQDLVPGQPLRYGVSITDACIGWDATRGRARARLAEAVRARRREARGRGVARRPLPARPRSARRAENKPSRPKSSSSSALDAAAMPRLLRHPALRPLRRGRTRTAHVVQHVFRHARLPAAARRRRAARSPRRTALDPDAQGPAARPGAGLHARAEYEWPLPGPEHRPVAARRHAVEEARGEGGRGRRTRRRSAPPNSSGGPSISSFRMEPSRSSASIAARSARRVRGRARARADRRGRDRARKRRRRESLPPRHGARRGSAARRDDRIQSRARLRAAPGIAVRAGVAGAAQRTSRSPPTRRRPKRSPASRANACTRSPRMRRGLVADDDPEWIHQMRVGTRRLRSCLSLMKRFAAERALDPVIAEVKWLAGLLGKARDWDVFVTETLPPLAAWFARDANTAPGHQAPSRTRGATPAQPPGTMRAPRWRRAASSASARRGSRLLRRRSRTAASARCPARRPGEPMPARRSPRSSSRGATASLPISRQRSRTQATRSGTRRASPPSGCATSPSSSRRSIPASARGPTSRRWPPRRTRSASSTTP